MGIDVSEQHLFVMIMVLVVVAVVVVLAGIQHKGDQRDRLISYMLEHCPDSVTRLGTNERVLRWTKGEKSLTVVYKENVLQDILYKYKDFEHDLTLSGGFKVTRDFDEQLLRVLG